MRDAFEKQFSGGYRRVYPIDDTDLMQKYDSFIETADKLYFSEFNVLRAQLEKEKSLAEGKKDNETLSPTKSTTDPKLAKAFSCK